MAEATEFMPETSVQNSKSPASSLITMANFQIPPPDILELNDGSTASNWRTWVSAWNNYRLATKLDKEEEARQVATLLAVIGKEANKVFRTFTWASPDVAKKIAAVVSKFEEYCIPRENTIYERFLFFTRDQRESETVDQYLTELHQIAANCDFESITPDQLLRDRLVTGTKTAKVRENLLKEKKLTLEKAIDIARAAESTAVQMKVMSAELGLSAVKEKEKEQSENVPSVSSGWIKDCRFCGRNHERRSCPAFGQICAYCKKRNHFVVKCPAKSKVSSVQERFYLSAAGVGNRGREMDTLTVSKESNPLSGHDVSFLMDTGAECNLLPLDVYKKVTGDLHLNFLNARGKSILVLANGDEQPIEGKATVYVSRKGNAHKIEVNVVRGHGYEPILSKQTMLEMNLIKILDSDQDPRVNVLKSDTEPLLEEYDNVFEGLGKLDGQYHIVTDESIRPVVHPPRRLPVAMTERVQRKLEEMVAANIIEQVDHPTDWVSSMLVVTKPSTEAEGETKLRICLDPRDLNLAIKREHFPMPTIEEIATSLNGAKLFSVFDASNGFWQVELDDESSSLTTFNTPFGRYRWKRLPFGINSAPEVWQRKMREHIEGLKGVEVIADDFVIVGFGNTPAEWQTDHDRNVRAFLDRCCERNLKLNKKKARLRQQEVPFIGHILTREGLKPDPHKVEAIVGMPDPTDVQSLRRFLGMVNYLAKFLPRLSEETEVLRKLTEKDVEWCWLQSHTDAVVHIKEMIVSAPVLAYYDVNKPVVIQCDASQSGLGAALLQEERPVAYSSRVMTQMEQNYAQIEKELLAIVYACEKFDQYIFGRSNVIVQSDHKPLETIFKKPIHSSPKRLQRMRLRLQNYDIQVVYKKGETMFLADTLSRAYLEKEPVSQTQDSDIRSVRERLFAFELEQIKNGEDLSVSPTRLEELRKETAQDEELQTLSDVIHEGWPETLSEAHKYDRRRRQVIELYWNSRDELTIEDGLVYKGHRLVIPFKERSGVVKSLHESHIGIEGTLRRARDIVYWPGITAQLKDHLSRCGICNRYQPEQCKEPLKPHDVPNWPWQKVGVDLFVLDGQSFLIAVDYYSGYFEVQDMSSTTSNRVITILKAWFSRHGIPVTLISDNGPPFNSEDFQTFSKEWDFHHVTSSPYHTQSNSRVENAVKTCKSLLTKARADKRVPLLALLEWRNTPTEGMNASPVQLLYGRRTRTRLPVAKQLLTPQVITDVPEKIKIRKQKQKYYYDRHSHELPKFLDGDAIRMRLPCEKEWSLGRVIGEEGTRSYLVKVNGKHYRRNRKWLRATPEELPESVETNLAMTDPMELVESSPAEPPQAMIPSSPVVSGSHTEGRPVRDRRPPVWLRDYEC